MTLSSYWAIGSQCPCLVSIVTIIALSLRCCYRVEKKYWIEGCNSRRNDRHYDFPGFGGITHMFARYEHNVVFLQRNVPRHIAIGKHAREIGHEDVWLCGVSASNDPDFLHQCRFLIHVCGGNGLQDRHMSLHGNHPRFLHIPKHEHALDLQHFLFEQHLYTWLTHVGYRRFLDTGFRYRRSDTPDIHLHKADRNLSILTHSIGEFLLAGTAPDHHLKRVTGLDRCFRGRDGFIGIDISLGQRWDRRSRRADCRRRQGRACRVVAPKKPSSENRTSTQKTDEISRYELSHGRISYAPIADQPMGTTSTMCREVSARKSTVFDAYACADAACCETCKIGRNGYCRFNRDTTPVSPVFRRTVVPNG